MAAIAKAESLKQSYLTVKTFDNLMQDMQQAYCTTVYEMARVHYNTSNQTMNIRFRDDTLLYGIPNWGPTSDERQLHNRKQVQAGNVGKQYHVSWSTHS